MQEPGTGEEVRVHALRVITALALCTEGRRQAKACAGLSLYLASALQGLWGRRDSVASQQAAWLAFVLQNSPEDAGQKDILKRHVLLSHADADKVDSCNVVLRNDVSKVYCCVAERHSLGACIAALRNGIHQWTERHAREAYEASSAGSRNGPGMSASSEGPLTSSSFLTPVL